MSIVQTMKEVARREINKVRTPELGVVTSVFPHSSESDKENYECSVRLKNSDLELRGVQIATQAVGLVSPPAVGDLVLVEFVGGDINCPVVVGRIYNEKDRPPLSKLGEILYVAPYPEDKELRRVYIELPGGMKVCLKDAEVTITAGGTKVTVERGGDVIIEAKGDVKVKSKGDTSIEAQGDISVSASNLKIEAQKDLSVSCGNDLTVDSTNNVKIKAGKDMSSTAGMNAEVSAGVQASVEGSASVKIKGGVVNIN
ncbi:MAG: phage baseplate assembly protein V [Candidatus Verstraetearchaeota archaeon]|nr:phage baseplate assembly protein V [Candidatus Verstraetearchaeota archaeon]